MSIISSNLNIPTVAEAEKRGAFILLKSSLPKSRADNIPKNVVNITAAKAPE